MDGIAFTGKNHDAPVGLVEQLGEPVLWLSADQAGKDIYEPIGSDLLASWAVGKDGVQVFV